MEQNSTTTEAADTTLFAGEAWFDPIEAGIRERMRGFIERAAGAGADGGTGARPARAGAGRAEGLPERHARAAAHRQLRPGRDERAARPHGGAGGGTQEWRSAVLPRYARMTRQMEALIAGAYLAGTNTRRVKRALGALFRGAVGKDVVSRTWRKVRTDWEAWSKRDLAGEDIVRLILDGTVVRVRLDRKATSLSLLVVLGVRRDGQKVLLSIKNMGGESEAAWRACWTTWSPAACARRSS